jgi:hypothetical protein
MLPLSKQVNKMETVTDYLSLVGVIELLFIILLLLICIFYSNKKSLKKIELDGQTFIYKVEDWPGLHIIYLYRKTRFGMEWAARPIKYHNDFVNAAQVLKDHHKHDRIEWFS